ncbi:MAG: molybdenum cofactor guanylyltransferase [Candidatus Lernaella stagnicola]|nr:molybdenum cofactor guanylyltransferase [Candidatus Lernaella stagnicola]
MTGPCLEEVAAVILAGGRSRRMGCDKALLEWGGRTLLDRAVSSMQALFSHVVVAGGEAARYPEIPAPFVPDVLTGGGAVVGVHAGLAGVNTPRAFVLAVDAPFPQDDLVRALVALDPTADWVVPRTAKGYEPLFAVYSQRCREVIEQQVAAGERRIMALADQVRTRIVEIDWLRRHDPELRSFVNINTPDDWRRWRAVDEEGKSS